MDRLLFYRLSIFVFVSFFKFSSCEICYSSVCEYNFLITRQQNFVWRHPDIGVTFDVEFEDGDFRTVETPARPAFIFGAFLGMSVDPLDVITTDGVKRNIMTINGGLPGPTIEVTYGAEIVVYVTNRLLDVSVGIHWHGMDQLGTPWMDGVSYHTQCPILPGHTFTYRFKADPAGTYWYHSHEGAQINDGLRGMLIVHRSAPQLSYSGVIVADWYHYDGLEVFATDPNILGSGGQLYTLSTDRLPDGTGDTTVIWNSGLINGKGRFDEANTWVPLTIFEVPTGQRHLFRVVNAGGEYSLEVSIDSHQLEVVALDGFDVDPITVDAVVVAIGARIDFQILAVQPVASYWMRARTLKDLDADPEIREVRAIVRYSGAPVNAEPTTSYRTCTAANTCRVIGCPFLRYPASQYTECINFGSARHSYTAEEKYAFGLDQEEPDVEYFLNLRITPSSVNFNSFGYLTPTAPLYQTDSFLVPCDECPDDEMCLCTHVLNVPYNKVVQFVVSNFQVDGGPIGAHPIHLHGYHFALLKVAYSDYKDYEPGDPRNALAFTPNPDITCDNALCRNARWTLGSQPADLNLVDPPLVDTSFSPPSGYFVGRIKATNPGPWLMHCHIHHHAFPPAHMKVLINVGGDFYYPPVPPAMPTCSWQFRFSEDEFEEQLAQGAVGRRVGGVFRRIQIPPRIESEESDSDSDSDDVSKSDDMRPRRPPTSRRTVCESEGRFSLDSAEFVGLIIGCIGIGILVTGLIALLFACGCCVCCRHPREFARRPIRFATRVQPSFATYDSKVFHVSPAIQYY